MVDGSRRCAPLPLSPYRKLITVASQDSISISLKYGRQSRLTCEAIAQRVAIYRPGPRPKEIGEATRQALSNPYLYPSLEKALISTDQVVLALDRNTPGAASVVNELWKFLARSEISPEAVTILQPASFNPIKEQDPRSLLPEDVRSRVGFKIHDPTDMGTTAYLTNASSGERICLAREVIDAGFVIPISLMGYDSVLGYRGGASVLYPGMSNTDAIKLSMGLGHAELAPRDIRPRRMLVDEIAWLLGVQFAVQLVPADGAGVCDVLAGAIEPVHRHARQLHDHHWLISLKERVATVVVAVPQDSTGHTWFALGRALEVAHQLVEPGGRIMVLSELDEAPGQGVELLRQGDDPESHFQQLRAMGPLDMQPAAQIVQATRWASVFLKSHLKSDLVEDLLMTPLSSDDEVERLIQSSDSVAIIGSAQHAYGIVD